MRKRKTIIATILILPLLLLFSAGALMYVCEVKQAKIMGPAPPLIHKNCRTMYPVVIAHHWGPPRHREYDARGKATEYFYRPVIDVLRSCGADIRVAVYSHDYDTTPARALELKNFIISNFTGNAQYMRTWRLTHPGKTFKVNLVGHSQGCQDSRYMISNLDMAALTASWTGLAGESRGTPMADLGMALYDNPLFGLFADRLLMSLFRDSCRDRDHLFRFIESVRCLSEDYMQGTGEYGPGGRLEGRGFTAQYEQSVYYQNWSARLRWMPREWSGLYPLWKYIQLYRGDNDIYTPLSSQIHDEKFVRNRGVLDGAEWWGGVHHMAFTGSLNQPNPGFSQEQFWIDLIVELREMGF